MIYWGIGALGAALVAGMAYRKQSLSLSGMAAAILMGTVYFGAAQGTWFWFGLLLLFFISSSILSKVKAERKHELEKSYAKTGRRDAGQVFANGGAGMAACLGYALWPDPFWAYFVLGTLAAVTADTWATELGGLSRRQPRSLLTWRPVPAGTSGGVSLLGSGAALLGALMIGGAGWLLLAWPEWESWAAWLGLGETVSGWGGSLGQFAGGSREGSIALPMGLSLGKWLLIGGTSGFAGAYVDSLLGATVQRMYRCQVCDKLVEVEVHCGKPTLPDRGMVWMNNDAVNILSALTAGLIAAGLGLSLG